MLPMISDRGLVVDINVARNVIDMDDRPMLTVVPQYYLMVTRLGLVIFDRVVANGDHHVRLIE